MIITPKLEIVLLDKTIHNTKDFDCGNEALNQFIRQYAVRQHKKGIGRTFIATNQDKEIVGFYTLCAGSVQHSKAPPLLTQGLPKYPVPTATLGRLAVQKQQQGKGVGGLLLKDALLRILAISNDLGIMAVVVDAKDNASASFYKSYGFIAFEDKPFTLYIPLKTIAAHLST